MDQWITLRVYPHKLLAYVILPANGICSNLSQHAMAWIANIYYIYSWRLISIAAFIVHTLYRFHTKYNIIYCYESLDSVWH